MPSWGAILQEIQTSKDIDAVRRKYLKNLSEISGRNTIAYYSGWLQFSGTRDLEISDNDMNGFMEAVHGLDKNKGLDLIIHTPGGSIVAAEAIVDYLHSIFKGDIRAIVPQLAMSAGTMIASACKEIIMGKESSLGPTDPQITFKTNTGYQSVPALAVLKEFDLAYNECTEHPEKMAIWHPILSQYRPGFIVELQNAVELSREFTTKWLKEIMFKENPKKDSIVDGIVQTLCNNADTKEHGRHFSPAKCKEIGLCVKMLEENQKLQDAVLSVHHAYTHTLTMTTAVKIIENQNGAAFMIQARKA